MSDLFYFKMVMVVRNFDPKIDIPYLQCVVKRYALIGSFRPFKNAKNHISKDTSVIEPFCGADLSFDYGLVTKTGFLDDEVKELSRQEVLKSDLLCKKCLKSFNK